MFISIQLLGFNEKNSSKSFIEKNEANKDDIALIGDLEDKHYDYVDSASNSLHPPISLINYELDIKDRGNINVDEKSFNKVMDECRIDAIGISNCTFALKKGLEHSFFFLLSIFLNLDCHFIHFMGENFEDDNYNKESFIELIKDRQRKGIPIVIQPILFF